MKKQILLVSNESDVLESFPVTLTLAGHTVNLAHGGLQGIKEARNTLPDLIVVDSALPDMDGPTVQEILRRLPSTGNIPSLLLQPRPHWLMPLNLQENGIRAGTVRPWNTGETMAQVADALALCRSLELEKQLAGEAV